MHVSATALSIGRSRGILHLRRDWTMLALVLMALPFGCSNDSAPFSVGQASFREVASTEDAGSSEPGRAAGEEIPHDLDDPAKVDANSAAPAAPASGPAESPKPALPRKIIYNGSVTLVVESITELSGKLMAMVKETGGYLSETDVSSYSRTRRRATWKVRIPFDKFDDFLARVSRLGELEQSHIDTQDVTQEYYDLDARIKNKQEEEKRLLKHLADSTGKLEDILAVERELSRVRGEIEQMQGRIRYLSNMTSMSTITIIASELKDYVPPVAPTFGAQIDRAFRGSLSNLYEFLQGAVLVVVALAPWVLVLSVVLIPLGLWLRRRIRRWRRTPS